MSTANVAHEPDLERRIPMSYEEWLTWDDEDRHSEWVDGAAIVFMPTTMRHGRLVVFLSFLLSFYLRLRPVGELFLGPNEMRLSPRVSREPDLFVVATEHLARVSERRLEGPADLVIEVVSDDSARRDRVVKYDEYARAGVREYWIVASRRGREAFEAYALTEDGVYAPIPLDEEGRLRSRVVAGFWLRPGWLLADPLPDPLACLRGIVPGVLASGGETGA